jgi:hypothetical protein
LSSTEKPLPLEEEILEIRKKKKEYEPHTGGHYLYNTALRIALSRKKWEETSPTRHFFRIFRIGFGAKRNVAIQYSNNLWSGVIDQRFYDQSLVSLLKKLLDVNW